MPSKHEASPLTRDKASKTAKTQTEDVSDKINEPESVEPSLPDTHTTTLTSPSPAAASGALSALGGTSELGSPQLPASMSGRTRRYTTPTKYEREASSQRSNMSLADRESLEPSLDTHTLSEDPPNSSSPRLPSSMPRPNASPNETINFGEFERHVAQQFINTPYAPPSPVGRRHSMSERHANHHYPVLASPSARKSGFTSGDLLRDRHRLGSQYQRDRRRNNPQTTTSVSESRQAFERPSTILSERERYRRSSDTLPEFPSIRRLDYPFLYQPRPQPQAVEPPSSNPPEGEHHQDNLRTPPFEPLFSDPPEGEHYQDNLRTPPLVTQPQRAIQRPSTSPPGRSRRHSTQPTTAAPLRSNDSTSHVSTSSSRSIIVLSNDGETHNQVLDPSSRWTTAPTSSAGPGMVLDRHDETHDQEMVEEEPTWREKMKTSDRPDFD